MIEELNKICKVETNASLLKYNTYKLDSYCYAFVLVNSVEELTSVIDIVNKYKSKWFIIGNGSNIILPEYYDGVIIKLNLKKCIISNDEVYVESGYMINKLALELANNGYDGLSFAAGIPGTIGGCVYGNAGCYGSSISDSLISATILDGGEIKELTNSDFNFSYRYSILKEKKDYVILSAKFKIYKSNKDEILSLINERQEKRKSTQDLTHPSCGSVFRNPEGLVAGKLIDDAGLKGTKEGGAMVSYKHANFIINDGGATSSDIVKLINKIKKEIKSVYDITLVCEQEIIK